MKILIDIGHPAHVHYFRNMIQIFKEKGHDLLVLARKKEITFELLNAYGIDYVPCGVNRKGMLGKALNLVSLDMEILRQARIFKPDIFLSPAILYGAHIGRLLGKPVIGFSDTEHATLNLKLFLPFADVILTPSCFLRELGPKQFRFNGYLELMYLHPNWFKPDPSILQELGIGKNDNFVIVRFVSWAASHDVGHSGITLENKIRAVKQFSEHARVFITSECKLPKELEQYRINISPYKIHDAMAYASLLFGESATMASESAVMGIPAIFLDNEGRGYTDEEEKLYSMVYNFTESTEDQIRAIEKGLEILQTPDAKKEYMLRHKKLLSDKIDVTAFMIWFVENYPNSVRIIKENPAFQTKFI